MSKSNQLWDLAIEWVSKKIRSPFSNKVTRFLLITGAGIVAAPLLLHMFANALLKHFLGIDLGVEPPGTMTYIAGFCFMLLGVVNNTIHNYLTHTHQVRVKNAEVSIYKETWGKLDTALDDTARLSSLYTTYYASRDEELVLKAEESIISCMDWLRKNRPFYYSDAFYEKCSQICAQARQETRVFRACIEAKKMEEATIGKNGPLTNHMEFYKKIYNYEMAQKEMAQNVKAMRREYEAVCVEIRDRLA
ncbi:hypothetical protein [Pseudomonas juntendi]|uniref:hypothetical protein n=1 Tax=Pseudomonas juntendi TaxID=2666183 RepID=UPI001F165C3E|nr:hypothetical protein [Pseudomonas juntendi]